MGGHNRRVRLRISCWPAGVPIAFHARHNGRNLRRERSPNIPTGIAFHEHDDGRHGAGHDLSDDGPRHAGDVAKRAAVLVRDVAGCTGGLPHRVSSERVVGGERNEARSDDRREKEMSPRTLNCSSRRRS